MAEKNKSRAGKAKAAPAASAATATTPRKAKRAAAKPKGTPRRASSSRSSGVDLVKLIDHPLVADLLAVGAIAAVAAIAEHNVKTRTGEAASGSSRAVKAAGKAAAAAIGKRLMSEVDAVRAASKAADARRGSR